MACGCRTACPFGRCTPAVCLPGLPPASLLNSPYVIPDQPLYIVSGALWNAHYPGIDRWVAANVQFRRAVSAGRLLIQSWPARAFGRRCSALDFHDSKQLSGHINWYSRSAGAPGSPGWPRRARGPAGPKPGELWRLYISFFGRVNRSARGPLQFNLLGLA